jgi:hypothetical protein
MFKTLWNSLSSQKSAESGEEPAFDRDKLKMLADFFPIGMKLRYYPEYQREIIFDTIIIAYRVNGQFIYSRDAIVLDGEGFPTGFRIPGNKMLPVAALQQFQLLLPDTTAAEKTLSYATRAELGRGGQFRIGNAVTLFVETDDRGIPTMDTMVDRRQVMNTGPFADSSTILVTPEFDSLMVADKRRKQRVEASIGADLYLAVGGAPYSCLLGDFSEHSLRLRTGDFGLPMPAMETGAMVIVEFVLGDAGTICRLRGNVFRRTDQFCVIDIEQVYKFGDFEKIQAMDVMEITTTLLNMHSGAGATADDVE